MSDDPQMLAAKVERLETHLDTTHEVIENLRAVVADLKCSLIAFAAPVMVEYARERGLPKGHLYARHYDILKGAGARMDDFTRVEIEETS